MNWEYQKEDTESRTWIFSHHIDEEIGDLLEIDLESDGEVLQWLTIQIKETSWLWN